MKGNSPLESREKTVRPIFILGAQRSGTTLFRLMLDSHSKIAIPFESFVLIDFASRINEYNNLQTTDDRQSLVNDLLSSKGISEWEPRVHSEDIDLTECNTYSNTLNQIFSAYARHRGKSLWGDKTPAYTINGNILNELFPYSRFINIIRDGRDVALSHIRQPWGPNDLVSALEHWRDVVTRSREMGRMLPQSRYMEILYEDLIDNPEDVLKKVTDFLELPFEQKMLDSHHNNVKSKLPKRSYGYHKNIGKPLDKNLAYKWMETIRPADQALAFSIAGELFEELGYPSGHCQTGRMPLAWRKAVHYYHWRKAYRFVQRYIIAIKKRIRRQKF